MITGGTEDEEDDIRPTLSPYASEDRDSGGHVTSSRPGLESVASSSQSTTRTDSTPRLIKSYPKCKSPMPPAMKSSSNSPGIDNSSFELGEEVQLPPCCKAREAAVVRRSNSFSPSKLTPKAFSPPMAGLSPRSERSLSPFGYRDHPNCVSPLPLPPSPLALEDSAFRMRTTPDSRRESAVSPLTFTHGHTLTVPSPHALYMRSPSPTPPKHVLLSLPTSESSVPVIPRRPVGSPAPLRRQQTMSRSSAVDYPDSSMMPSPMRRRIPHTLSMDSALLAPPGLPQSYSINEPFLELHAGCRATSPLPSPRNSQQTLPGMFTRSASPRVFEEQEYTDSQTHLPQPTPSPQASNSSQSTLTPQPVHSSQPMHNPQTASNTHLSPPSLSTKPRLHRQPSSTISPSSDQPPSLMLPGETRSQTDLSSPSSSSPSSSALHPQPSRPTAPHIQEPVTSPADDPPAQAESAASSPPVVTVSTFPNTETSCESISISTDSQGRHRSSSISSPSRCRSEPANGGATVIVYPDKQVEPWDVQSSSGSHVTEASSPGEVGTENEQYERSEGQPECKGDDL